MATSSTQGIDRAPRVAPGRDSEDLGPSDTSDSGSDVAGIETTNDGGDPFVPADVATGPDSRHSDTVPDAFEDGVDADHTGTGERRTAAGDAGRDAADIEPDRITRNPDADFDLDADEPDPVA